MPCAYYADQFKDIAMSIVYETVMNEKNIISIGSIELPVPQMTVEPNDYATWVRNEIVREVKAKTEETKDLIFNPSVAAREKSDGMKEGVVKNENTRRSVIVVIDKQ